MAYSPEDSHKLLTCLCHDYLFPFYFRISPMSARRQRYSLAEADLAQANTPPEVQNRASSLLSHLQGLVQSQRSHWNQSRPPPGAHFQSSSSPPPPLLFSVCQTSNPSCQTVSTSPQTIPPWQHTHPPTSSRSSAISTLRPTHQNPRPYLPQAASHSTFPQPANQLASSSSTAPPTSNLTTGTGSSLSSQLAKLGNSNHINGLLHPNSSNTPRAFMSDGGERMFRRRSKVGA